MLAMLHAVQVDWMMFSQRIAALDYYVLQPKYTTKTNNKIKTRTFIKYVDQSCQCPGDWLQLFNI